MARISSTEIPGVSSIKIRVSDKRADRVRRAVPIRSSSDAGAKAMRIDLRLASEHTRDELLLRHFEREDGDDSLFVYGGVLCEFRQSAVLPIDGRPATMIRSVRCRPEVISSSSRKPVARPVVPCASRLGILLDLVPAPGRRSAASVENLCRSFGLGQRKDRLLGVVEYDLGVVFFGKGFARDLRCRCG